MCKSKTSAKQPNRATALFGNGRNNASDSEEEGAATFFSKKYTPTHSAKKRASYDAWLSTKRADHRSEEKRGGTAEQEAALIDRQSHETDVRLRMRALEQENQQHRFLALACHREFVKMDAVELLDKAMRSSHKLWQTKMGTKPKKKAKRDSEDRLYDSDELYSPGNSDVEEVMQHKPAERRSMAESMSMSEDENDEDDEDDQKPIAKPGRNSKLAKNTKGLGKVHHAAASIAGASKTIDKGKGSGKGKKKKSKDPNRQKRVMLAYNFFVQEKTATVAAEGIPPGPDRYKRLGVLWAEQKTKPEGTAKWDKLAADAKAERAAEKAAEETNALGAENDIDDDDETMGEDGEDGDDAIDD